MSENASEAEIATIKALASDVTRVTAIGAAVYSLMSLRLTVDDICTEIIGWIDAGERVKKVSLHSFTGKVGNTAFELKPRINGSIIYIKVTIELAASGKQMLVLSAHPDY